MSNPIKLVAENDVTKTRYMCSECESVHHPSDDAADKCCRCQTCGVVLEQPWRSRLYCVPCHEQFNEKRRAERVASMEIVREWTEYLVYNGHFYTDIDDLMDDLEYSDPSTVVVHPTVRANIVCPDLAEYVVENWAGEYQGEESPEVPLQDELDELTKRITEQAPEWWEGDTRKRIDPALVVAAHAEYWAEAGDGK